MTERRPQSVATRGPDGTIVPGAWIVPGLGPSRFTTKRKALKCAKAITDQYGPNCWDTKVEVEPSKSRPGKKAYQVYIRSMGAMEGLVR